MFKNYPKTRTELPEAYRLIYVNQYKENREGESTASGIAQKVEAWLHKKVAEDVKGDFYKKLWKLGLVH